jgi:nondiscriminating glutamyl-tRNA synthetase
MAPSPTGFLHIGGLRTALYDFLFARKNFGKFILRIEDTDRARFVEGALENIVETFDLFQINSDEGPYWENGVKSRGEYGPYFQSQRLETYKKYALELIDKQHAYYCFCSQERLDVLRKTQTEQKKPTRYDKHCLHLLPDDVEKRLKDGEKFVIRLNVPENETIKFIDLVHGEISISTNEIDDQVLIKSDGYPTYHLGVVVDDHLMKISHVIRGDEWIPSTPKHILLYKFFNWETPEFIHLPLLQNREHKKLSKRDGDVAVKEFLDKGYLPEAILNFVALLGWNPKTEQEIFSLTELIDQFDVKKINKSWAVFDLEKLDWINGLYIRKMDLTKLTTLVLPYLIKAGVVIENYSKNFLEGVVGLEQERLKKLSDIADRVTYFFKEPEYDSELLKWKDIKKETLSQNLQKLSTLIQTFSQTDFARRTSEEKIRACLLENNISTGEALWPLRVALTGQKTSPGPFEIMETLNLLPAGKEIILKRINLAAEKLF